MKHRKFFLCYADGGGKMGLGHLSRLTTLSQKLNIQDKVVFLYDNLEQKIFYNSLSIEAHNITKFKSKDNEYKILFIDTKSIRSDIFESLHSFADFSVLIDNNSAFQESFDCCINPSFYAPQKSFALSDKLPIILSGIDYAVVRDEFLPSQFASKANKLELKHCTLSFGGVDPNNITLKVVKYLSQYDAIMDDLVIILGSGYSHNLNLLLNYVSPHQIIRDPKNMYPYFASSYIVMTALGVTIQELFSMGVCTGIITNYQNDTKDLKAIDYFSKKILNDYHSNQINFFGHYKEINYQKLIKDIKKFKHENKIQRPCIEMGKGWRTFLNDINSI